MSKLFVKDIGNIAHLYKEGLSIKDISIIYGVTYAPMQRFFKKHLIQRRTLSEAKKISKKTMVGLKKWQLVNGSWYRGTNKNDPRVASAIEKGRVTQIRNGKNKGSNNPMHGKLPSARAGYRKDLKHFVRSGWEANFARILKYLEIDYIYEGNTFQLSNGETYTPDFFIPSKNKYYEIKGYERNNKFSQFQIDFPEIRSSIIREDMYNRLIYRFSNKILINDKESLYFKSEINKLFLQFCETNDKISVSKFCHQYKISIKMIKRMFRTVKNLTNVNSKKIKKIELKKFRIKFKEYVKLYNKNPSYKAMQKFYIKTATMLRKYFSSKYQTFINWIFNTNVSPNNLSVVP